MFWSRVQEVLIGLIHLPERISGESSSPSLVGLDPPGPTQAGAGLQVVAPAAGGDCGETG